MPGKGLSNQICWSCGRACGGCSWSAALIPVRGWTALRVKNKNCETYAITGCPLYVGDGDATAEAELWVPQTPEEKRIWAKLYEKNPNMRKEVTRIATGLIARGGDLREI